MALNAGDAGCTTGLSGRIYTNWTGAAANGFSVPLSSDQTAAVKALCYAVALAVVDEIMANASVQTLVQADDFGAGIPPSPTYVYGGVT